MSRGVVLVICGCLSLSSVALGAPDASVRAAVALPRKAFAIPALPLPSALIAFGMQANVQLLTAGGTSANLRSEGVNGTLPVDAALARLLQGTDLDYEFIDAGTVVVRPRWAVRPPAPRPETVAALKADMGDAKLLSTVRSMALLGSDEGYMVDISDSATRTISSLADVPQSVSIVTRDLIDSQQLRSVADAVRNVAGVQGIEGNDGVPLFQIRGFYTGNGMTDGMPNSVSGLGDFPPLIGVERIEVLKGPESILGDLSVDNNFGGLINVVMKKPQSRPLQQLSFALGPHGDTQTGLDLAGPLSPHLSYRMVLSGEYADRTEQGYHGDRRAYFAPSIGWQNDSTRFIAGLQYIAHRLPVPDYSVLLGDSLATASPDGLLLGNPRDHSLLRTNRFTYSLEHRFATGWMWRSRGQYAHQSKRIQGWIFDSPMPSGDITAIAQSYRYSDNYYTLQNDLTGVFSHGMFEHTVVIGFDYSRTKIGSSTDFFQIAGTPYNIFTSARLPSVQSVLDMSSGTRDSSNPWTTDCGWFLQDQIAIGEHWNVLLAMRRSSYQLNTEDADGNPQNLRKTRWVPNAGVVYKLTPDVSLYGSLASGFQPDTLLGKNGKPLRPASSRQTEFGTKFSLFQGRARLSAALYRITLDRSTDLVTSDPPYFAMPGPGQINKGIEVEFTGQVAPGTDITANYTDARIRNRDGTLATGAPHQRLSLWASYRVPSGAWQGWGVAGGITARSRSVGMNWNTGDYFDIPGQASMDASLSYQARDWSLTLGVRNLFDRRLHGVNFNESFVPLQRRRTFLLSGTYNF
ncbi:iron complex outermembrane recepter protein [Dyella sp. OK004]|uniref:TonB-dependent siderophore receptor n=1 Tax=Dyella sp. OK004 TaxID=1855292 RepID=UPI0008DFAB53|nr:TonB-dependent receptor [Dyella sp. OK004]SFS14476.1 iron complex outermembrane recepter protein [Dyella sp. OK004]